ncbi:hypothetical protein BHE74_00011109 [Ensete ventricosum]|nr:hypothetical protein BHE74_00011109 [Ensete ventricosum]RZS19836.1 hypothetical protein BHM03_00052280 [Ensete ventricosum]
MFMDPKSFPATPSVLWSSSKVREYIDGSRASPPPFPSVPDPPPPLPLPIMLLLPKQAMPDAYATRLAMGPMPPKGGYLRAERVMVDKVLQTSETLQNARGGAEIRGVTEG